MTLFGFRLDGGSWRHWVARHTELEATGLQAAALEDYDQYIA